MSSSKVIYNNVEMLEINAIASLLDDFCPAKSTNHWRRKLNDDRIPQIFKRKIQHCFNKCREDKTLICTNKQPQELNGYGQLLFRDYERAMNLVTNKQPQELNGYGQLLFCDRERAMKLVSSKYPSQPEIIDSILSNNIMKD